MLPCRVTVKHILGTAIAHAWFEAAKAICGVSHGKSCSAQLHTYNEMK
jgi:hypothetical protein